MIVAVFLYKSHISLKKKNKVLFKKFAEYVEYNRCFCCCCQWGGSDLVMAGCCFMVFYHY